MKLDPRSHRRETERERSRGLRPTLLFFTVVAALLLVPAAQAFAESPHLELTIVGNGSGEVESLEIPEVGAEPGTPPINCSYDGTTQSPSGCENEPGLLFGEGTLYAMELLANPAVGSEVAGWTVEQGAAGECPNAQANNRGCTIFGEDGEGIEWKITVEFALTGPVEYKLNLNTSGTGSGSFECEVESSGTPEPCEEEYEEGTAVKVIPVPAPGSEFVAFTTEHGGECTGATCEFTMNAEHTANAKIDLASEAFSETVTGPGSMECKDETAAGSFGPCAPSYPFGHTIKVKAVPNTGAHQVSLTGSGSASGHCSGAECSFSITEVSGASATFALDEEALTIEEPGTGTGTVQCNGGSCAGPWHYGDNIEVTATPTGGSTLGPISGTGSAALCSGSPCSFEIKQATTVSVTFNPAGAATLTVIKGGNGSGTIESTTGGINCGLTCSGSFASGEVVTLKETPASSGSVFLAWSGNCTPISATECEVEVKPGGSTVTAAFAAVPVISTEPPGGNCEFGGTKIEYAGSTEYICNGLVGEDGKNIVVGVATVGECPEGGITVEVEGEPSTKRAICNGHTGQDGEPGEKGERGEIGFPGTQGLQGPIGPTGATGATGAAGAAGGQGPQGAQGPQGPAGKVTVSCKVTNSKKVTCRVKNAKASANSLRWSLRRDGHVVSHGFTSTQRLQRLLNHLRAGRYILEVNGKSMVLSIR
jgi:hypothetical protein